MLPPQSQLPAGLGRKSQHDHQCRSRVQSFIRNFGILRDEIFDPAKYNHTSTVQKKSQGV
jgi:hypothetical protein